MPWRTKPFHFWHVTEKEWGSSVLLYPRHSHDCERRPGEEPNTPRICVCPTVAQCLAAIPVGEYPLNVYRTARKQRALYPHRICDSYITQERWLDKPTTFIKRGLIHKDLISVLFKWYGCGQDSTLALKRQERALVKIQQILAKNGLSFE